MARGDIVFIKGQGANKRVAPGQDYISGIVLYAAEADLPSGFTLENNIEQVFSLADAENKGIVDTHSDETAATASYDVTGAGTDGDTINITVTETFGDIVDLGTYTKVVGDADEDAVAVGIAAVINGGTLDHGYTAVAALGEVTITARPKLGIFLNSDDPITVTLSAGATLAGTLSQFAGGIASKTAVWHYHIQEYFRGNPSTEIWIGFFPIPATYDFAEITLLQTASAGSLRQVGIYKDSEAYAVGDLTKIDTEIKTYNDAKHKPLSALYAADLKATADITDIPSLAGLSANKVSSIIGQDGANLGATLFLTTGKSITHLGIALGMLSLSAVSEDFGQPAKFNLSDGSENDVPAFANGQLLSDPAIGGDNALDSIDGKRHIFGQQYVGFAGTFFNENHCAVVSTSDYSFINDNRVIDKAIRGIYTALIPYLKGKLLYNADGTLASSTIEFFQAQALQPLYQMSRDEDLSEVVPDDVYIDPSQEVKSTGNFYIEVKLNATGIARNIIIPISFK